MSAHLLVLGPAGASARGDGVVADPPLNVMIMRLACTSTRLRIHIIKLFAVTAAHPENLRCSTMIVAGHYMSCVFLMNMHSPAAMLFRAHACLVGTAYVYVHAPAYNSHSLLLSHLNQ